MAEVMTITQENFEAEVLKSEKPVLIDFWAEWCGPCQTFIPIIHSYAEKTDAVKVGKINVDENRELAKDYGLKQVPALVIKDESGNSTYVGVPEIKKYLA